MRRRFWRAVARFAIRRSDRGGGYDWTEDDSLTGQDIRARMSLLPKAEVVTTQPGVVITSTWPVSTMPQTWASGGGT